MTPEERTKFDGLVNELIIAAANDEYSGGFQSDQVALNQSIDELAAFCSTLTAAPPWTSEAPRVAGDYRWRRDERSHYTFRRIVAGLDGSVFVDHGEDYDDPLELGGQWSGPLPEPKGET